VMALAVVIGLLYLCFYLLRRLAGRRRLPESGSMKVLDVLPLGPKTRLVTLQMGRRVLLIGAGEQSVNAVAEFDLEELQRAASDLPRPPAPASRAGSYHQQA